MLEPVLRAERSPLQPFSQGCATANVQKDGKPHAFFVSRDGQYWLHDERPAALADLDIWEFGDFSGGRAWFRAMGEGLQESYGWIDQGGEMILGNDFSGAGEFVDGRAPAAKNGRYSWAYIDLEGNPVLPDRWKFNGARAFSEGLAAAEVKAYRWMYFSTEGAIAIDHVSLKIPREVIGNMISEADIEAAGDFHDGLAAILSAKMFYAQELIYIRPDGSEAFAPAASWASRSAVFRAFRNSAMAWCNCWSLTWVRNAMALRRRMNCSGQARHVMFTWILQEISCYSKRKLNEPDQRYYSAIFGSLVLRHGPDASCFCPDGYF